MSFARTKQTGNGRLDYRLEVAGWPQEWTTSARLTHADGRDSREVFPGLQYTGLKISEKAILKDCWVQCTSITVKIKPTTLREETIDSFTRTAVPIAYLAEHEDVPGIDFDSTAMSLDGSATLPAGFYHIASECIHSDGANNITRAKWSTTAQRHFIIYGATSAISVPVYAYPPTMEGRRAVLSVYGEGDDGAGDGTVIWRGIVARPPALDNDGIGWTIQIDPIIKSLDQNVAAAEAIEYRVRGIYHGENSPALLTLKHRGGPYTDGPSPQRYLTGFWETPQDFSNALNAKLAELITERAAQTTPDSGEVATATYQEFDNVGPQIKFQTTTSLPSDVGSVFLFNFSVWFEVASNLEGFCTSSVGSMKTTASAGTTANNNLSDTFYFITQTAGASSDCTEHFGNGSGEFITPLGKDAPYSPFFTYPLSAARAQLGNIAGATLATTDSLHPANRLYLDRVDGLEANEILLVKNGDKIIPIKITNVEVDSRYVDVEIQGADKIVWFDASTMLTPARVYAQDDTLGGFITALTDQAYKANDGDSPYIPPGDVSTTRFQDIFTTSQVDDYWRHRNYVFLKPTPVKRILGEELKAIGWMTRVELDGEIGCTPLPVVAANRAATAIAEGDILLPARGMSGAWVGWQAQADGLVNSVDVRLGYNPANDDYDQNYDFSVREIASISEHKSNGRGTGDIAPVSTPAQRPSWFSGAFSGSSAPSSLTTASDFATAPTPAQVAQWVSGYLRVLSIDYATVTIQVPFRFFDLLLGDLVDVTCSMIPDGTGRRGIVNKKAAVVGRDWNLDPAANGMGVLTLYFPREVSSGYAPSGHITSATNVSGNTWDIHCDGSDELNVLMSEFVDGNVLRHFAIGDKVLVVQRDVGTLPINVKGIVTAVSSSTVRVVFDTTWSPGSDEWILEYQTDDGTLTAHQHGFTFVADALKQLADGSIARRYL